VSIELASESSVELANEDSVKLASEMSIELASEFSVEQADDVRVEQSSFPQIILAKRSKTVLLFSAKRNKQNANDFLAKQRK
jgi:hypothetical protein